MGEKMRTEIDIQQRLLSTHKGITQLESNPKRVLADKQLFQLYFSLVSIKAVLKWVLEETENKNCKEVKNQNDF